MTLNGKEYEPLRLDPEQEKIVIQDSFVDDALKSRKLPIRLFVPAKRQAAPVILFSHGLGGSVAANRYQLEHWAKRGYVVVALQHPGSDETVWQKVSSRRRWLAMQAAASMENWKLRVEDVARVIQFLEVAQTQDKHLLNGRLDLKKLGMSGHSFGAVTTQAVSGQITQVPKRELNFTHPKIRAALLMSPSARPGASFSQVKIPWMILTGTEDHGVVGSTTPESRRKVFESLPPGNKYELVLHGAEHSTFSDRALTQDRHARNPNHHRAILALSTAFWDTSLKGDLEARAWLHGDAPRDVLESQDLWQRK